MNGPHIRKCAEEFTKTLTQKDPLIAAYEKALGRKPEIEEEQTSRVFLEQQAKAYKAAGQNNPEQLALTDLAQTLFALNEFSYIR
jgi:hypothetical protein